MKQKKSYVTKAVKHLHQASNIKSIPLLLNKTKA